MSEAQLFVATKFTEIYEHVLVGPLFRPFAEQLIARAALTRGDSVIDVACGTGIAARLARERLGPAARIVGVDVAPAMLAVARTVDRTIDWRQGNAASLPVSAGERFTVLTCHQGLQFMPDKPAAMCEMRRVLAPGGRVAIATWSSLDDLPEMAELNAVAARHVGRIVDSRHSFGDASALRHSLIDAGFSEVSVGTLAHGVRFDDGARFARLNAMAVIAMSEKGKAMSEAERGELAERIAAESHDVIARGTQNGILSAPSDNNLCNGPHVSVIATAWRRSALRIRRSLSEGTAPARRCLVTKIRSVAKTSPIAELRSQSAWCRRRSAGGARISRHVSLRHKYGTMDPCARRSIFPTKCTAS